MAAWREEPRAKREDRRAGTFAKRNGLRRRGELRRGAWFAVELHPVQLVQERQVSA